MSRVTAVVADDEPLVRRGLKRSLAAEGVEVVGEARNGKETVELVLNRRPDLLFLDVQMPEMDGVTALGSIPEAERPATVFVTAYDQFALKAFELHAADYLLKPFDEERFKSALDHARARRNDRRLDLRAVLDAIRPPGPYLQRFAVTTGRRTVLVNVESVDWIEAADNYARIHAGPARHLIRETLSHLEVRLDPTRFVRIHRSAIVRLAAIAAIHRLPSGDEQLLLTSGARLPVSRGYRSRLSDRLTI
jgi:two-component system LytT family response regulator